MKQLTLGLALAVISAVAGGQVAVPSLGAPQIQGPFFSTVNVKSLPAASACANAQGNATIVSAAGAGTRAVTTGTDDTQAIQCAINFAAGVACVYFPPSNYLISSVLTLPSRSCLRGAGWTSILIFNWYDATGAASGGQVYLENTHWQTGGDTTIQLTDLYLRGAGPGTPSGTGATNSYAGVILFRGTTAPCSDVDIHNIKITNSVGIAIAIQGCQGVKIANNLLRSLGRDGITSAWFNNQNLSDEDVTNNTIIGLGDDGIACLASISGIANSNARPLKIRYVGNQIYNHGGASSVNGGRGITLRGCEKFTVADNIIDSTFSEGIEISYDDAVGGGSTFSSRKGVVGHNTITEAGRTGNGTQPQHGIRVVGTQNVAIDGNIIDHPTQTCIIVTDNGGSAPAANTDFSVTSNVCSNAGTAVTDWGITAIGGAVGGCVRGEIAHNRVTLGQSGGIGVQSCDDMHVVGNQTTQNGAAQANATDKNAAGIILANFIASATPTGYYVEDNYSTDTRASPKQTYGLTQLASGNAIAKLNVRNNTLWPNQTAGYNVAGINTVQTLLGNQLSAGADQGTATLVAGTVTISTAEVQAGDSANIVLSRDRLNSSPALGLLTVGTITAGTSFVVNSETTAGALANTDVSRFYWWVVH